MGNQSNFQATVASLQMRSTTTHIPHVCCKINVRPGGPKAAEFGRVPPPRSRELSEAREGRRRTLFLSVVLTHVCQLGSHAVKCARLAVARGSVAQRLLPGKTCLSLRRRK